MIIREHYSFLQELRAEWICGVTTALYTESLKIMQLGDSGTKKVLSGRENSTLCNVIDI